MEKLLIIKTTLGINSIMDKNLLRKRRNISIEMGIIYLFSIALYLFFWKYLEINNKISLGIILTQTTLMSLVWGFFFIKASWLKDIHTGKEFFHINISNILSAIRFALVPMLIAVFGQVSDTREDSTKIKVIITIFAAIVCMTDMFDGMLARKLNQVTKLGMVLDPVGDFLMITAFAILMFSKNIMSWWFFTLIMIRIPGLFLIMVIFLMADFKFKIKTSFLGKATIFYLMCALAVEAINLFFPHIPYYNIFILCVEITGSGLIVASSAQKLVQLHYYITHQNEMKEEKNEENIKFQTKE